MPPAPARNPSNPRSINALLCAAAAATAFALAGCGGGSGGSTASSAAAPAPAAPVPAATAPAPAPTITGISPASLTPPGRVTVSGTNLDRVTQATLGGTALSIAAQSATSLALDVPAGAASNFITLSAPTGTVQSSQQLLIGTAVTFATLAPASVLPGATLTITGTALDRVTSIEFTGGASASVASRTGTTALTVTVPNAASSGAITLVGTGVRVASGSVVTIIPRITVINATANTASAGASITLNGSGFGEVSGVQVGSTSATVTARTTSSLTFTVPAGVSCGPITLLSASQPAVNGGSIVAASGCAVRLESLEYAQVLSQTTSDTYAARLVPGKRTVVRAYVVTATAGTAAPTVRLTAFNGTTQLGTLDMTGPATLPVVAAGAPLPDSVRYDELQTFNAVLPAAWVASGLRVQVTADAEQRLGAPATRNETPAVGTPTRLDLVIVPLVANGIAPTIAANTVTNAVDELARRMPVARDRITVTLRAPYPLTDASISGAVDTSAEWSAALAELRTLRNMEGAGKVYYGMVNPGGVTSGIAGIGYVSSSPGLNAPLASLGWDTSFGGWRRTFIHELGHNFSRNHAPCGNVSGADGAYPYTGGIMSTTPLFDSLVDDVLSPLGAAGANTRDVMGYCNGSWFSDYNYRAVQLFLEGMPNAQTQVQAQVQAAKVGSAGEVLVISGSIGLGGVRLAPVQVTTGLADAPAAGDYMLQMQLADGRTLELPFDAELVDHAMPPERHFLLRVPNPGPLAGLQVVRGSVALARTDAAQVNVQRAAEQMRATRASAGGAAAMGSVSVSELGGTLELRWDAAAYPILAVSHVGKERRVLAVQLRGGQARLDIADLPAGGSYEFSLSDGLNVARAVATR
jgi:hypothetical protein